MCYVCYEVLGLLKLLQQVNWILKHKMHLTTKIREVNVTISRKKTT